MTEKKPEQDDILQRRQKRVPRGVAGAFIAALAAGYVWMFFSEAARMEVLILVGLLLAAIILRFIQLVAFMGVGFTIAPPAATAASPCPTSDTLIGESSYETAPRKSAAGARRAANSLLQGRADTEAGLANAAYQCPNPACLRKALGPVTATPKAGFPRASPFTLFAILATVFDLFGTVHYSGLMEYDWSATVTCS